MVFQLPVDGSQLQFIGMGKVQPKIAWVEQSDGSRRPDPNGRQDTDKSTGHPLWVVDVVIDDDEDEGRAETIGVTVACPDRPEVGKFKPVEFEGLTANPYVPKNGRRASWSFRATGIAGPAVAKSSKSTSNSAASTDAA